MTFIRYVTIQLVAYIIDMGGFLIILKFGVFGPLPSNVVSKIAAGIFAFFAHRHVTFRCSEKANRNMQAILYFTLLVINIPFSTIVLSVILEFLYTVNILDACNYLVKLVKISILDILVQPAMENRLKFLLDQTTIAKLISDILCIFVTYWLSKAFVFGHSRSNIPVAVQSKSSKL